MSRARWRARASASRSTFLERCARPPCASSRYTIRRACACGHEEQQMRTRFLPMIALCVGATLLAVASDRSAADGEGFVRLTPGEIRWQDIPGGHGARMATIAGDPARPGIYVQRVRFPPHVMDRPHWHPGNRYVTVLEGTWFTGTGATF